MTSGSVRKAASAWAGLMLPRPVRDRLVARQASGRSLPSYPYLRNLMSCYTVDHLVGVTPAAFESRIRAFLELTDAQMEGYRDPASQRDLSVRFHWGHDHDFGSFALAGRMGERHLTLLATFTDTLGILPRDLTGAAVLDVGCWTGGSSLLLSGMGADVVAIDEVKKYVDCLAYLAKAFGVSRLQAWRRSLYECSGPDFADRFDFVLFAGVIYHVTDPVLALRVTFNSLKDGGWCLVESAVESSGRDVLAYQGPRRILAGSERDLSRAGWNWYVPSPSALGRMMEDVGFTQVKVREAAGSRAYAVGQRERHVDMLRAGLSFPGVR